MQCKGVLTAVNHDRSRCTTTVCAATFVEIYVPLQARKRPSSLVFLSYDKVIVWFN